MNLFVLIPVVLFAGLGLIGAMIVTGLRRVVPTNEVHIVQSGSKQVSYGGASESGNSYYQWPTWLPMLGVMVSKLPTSVFNISLKDYEAYDHGRLPFAVDVTAFFRVKDSNTASQRVAHFEELKQQLTIMVQGAIRAVLAKEDIEQILSERSKFGELFTKEVDDNLTNWGVITVKNIELMDIRDGSHGNAIDAIMNKKKSQIDMESRTAVAQNAKLAQTAEIESQREIELRQQDKQQQIGMRAAQTKQEIGLADQKAQQAVFELAKTTKEKEMEVKRVEQVRQAEIDKEKTLVKADQDKQSTVIAAEAKLEQQKREAQGVEAQGKAKATADTAIQLAPVQAQITLAKEIGSNENYQKYLTNLKQIEATRDIGIEQAKALTQADIKVIANSGSPGAGLTKVMDLFSAKGGTELVGMLEAFNQSDAGKAITKKFLTNGEDKSTSLN